MQTSFAVPRRAADSAPYRPSAVYPAVASLKFDVSKRPGWKQNSATQRQWK
jgi:hypothetical protein